MNENIKKIEELLEKGQYAEVLIAIDKCFDKPLPTHIARFIEQFKQELWHSKPDKDYHGRLLLAVHELSALPTPLQDQIRELQANIKLLQKQYDTLLMEHKALQNEENTTLNELTEAKSNLITQKRQFERLLASQKAELQAKETEVTELQNALAYQKKDTVQIDALKKSVREGELAYQKIQGMYEGLLEKYNAQQTQQQTFLADYQRLKHEEEDVAIDEDRLNDILNKKWKDF